MRTSLCRIIAALCVLGGLCAPAMPAHAQEAPATVVRGRVVDAQGAPLAFANVQLVGTVEGTAADTAGRFRFRTRRRGTYTLRASLVGYAPAEKKITLGARDTLTVRLVLRKEIVQLDEAVVSASTIRVGLGEAVTLGMLDVVTTPGAAGDFYRALRTFPGVTGNGPGSSLFVRGGGVNETITLLDNAPVAHPYKYASSTTSSFGVIPPFLVKGIVFSAGGFSAKYGNALSGVLALESRGYPEQTRFYANLSLAAASLGVDWPLTDRLGLRFSGNRSFTGLLFRVNGTTNAFSLTPRSTDANLSLIYEYAPGGRVKFFNYFSTYRMGVRVDKPSFSAFYRSSTENGFHNLFWTDRFGGWTLEANASFNRFTTHKWLRILDLHVGEEHYQLRLDAVRELGERLRLKMGAQAVRAVNTFRGTVPAGEVNLHAEEIQLDEAFAATRAAGYVEVAFQPFRRMLARVGVRSAYHTLADEAIVDPRAAVRYVLSEDTDLRFAWGIYHQFPKPRRYNTVTGNPALGAERAQHFIAGVEHETGRLLARLEAYYKPYADLVLQAPERNYTNEGYGMARGVDFFLKYGAFLQTYVYGRVAYSFLQARRLQPRRLGREVVFAEGPAPFDVTHHLALVVRATLPRRVAGGYLSGGFTWRYATGRPHTPIVDAVPVEEGDRHVPIEGPVGSERLPAYRRLALQVNYYLPLGERGSIVFYASVSNALSRANVRQYEYSADYSKRTAQTVGAGRSYYFGAIFEYAL